MYHAMSSVPRPADWWVCWLAAPWMLPAPFYQNEKAGHSCSVLYAASACRGHGATIDTSLHAASLGLDMYTVIYVFKLDEDVDK
jgi:hypothetical protein